MNTVNMRAASPACADTHEFTIERALQEYPWLHAPGVHALAHSHPYLEDLTLSFPALLFALAAPRRGFDPTAAISAVKRGARLPEVAAMANVPLWLRNFPASGLSDPLQPLPDGELIRRQIANHMPRRRIAAQWLRYVSIAATAGTDAFVVWTAREFCSPLARIKGQSMHFLALWAWYSQEATALAKVPPSKPWTGAMSLKAAKIAAREWLCDVRRYIELGAGVASVWHELRYAADHEFVPLRSPTDLVEEATAMQHCIDSYSYSIARNRVRVWSIRHQGERVATLELFRPQNGPIPQIRQIQAMRNQPAPKEVWWAAFEWLAALDARRTDLGRFNATPPIRARWRALWRPYWLAKGHLPAWLPLMPTYIVFD